MKTRVLSLLLTFGLAVLLLCFAVSCQNTSGGTSAGVVASVTIGDPQQRPEALFRYDGLTFVAWGSEQYLGEVFIQATGLPLYMRAGGAKVALVHVRKPEFQWKGAPGDPLPEQARSMFRPAEIDQWGILFETPTVAP